MMKAAWAQLPDTENLPINISLTLLHALHARWYRAYEQYDRSSMAAYHLSSREKNTITLWELLKIYSWHSRHHTAHITSLRERMKWN